MKDIEEWWNKKGQLLSTQVSPYNLVADALAELQPKMTAEDRSAILNTVSQRMIEAAQPEWLPIESAPKDGDDIWLYDRQWSPSPQIGYWCYYLGSWLSDSGSKLNPTHYQLLPESPKLKGKL